MSKSLIPRQRKNHFATILNDLQSEQSKTRALQPQGSGSIRVSYITAYQLFTVPTTIIPQWAYFDFTADDPNEIVIATIAHSTFMKYTDGTLVNADLESHGLGDDVWNIWMAFDNRPTPVDTQITYAPSGTFDARLHAHLAAFSLPHNQARIGVRVNRVESYISPPSNLSQYLIVFQIRIVIGGADE